MLYTVLPNLVPPCELFADIMLTLKVSTSVKPVKNVYYVYIYIYMYT